MTTTDVSSSGANALAYARPADSLHSGWPPAARDEIGTLPLSRLRRVTDHIQEHLDQDLTLAQLGAIVCMSPFHFARLFQRSTGVPPHQFVVRMRIDRALTLLAAQERSIGEVARAVGFRTPSHFSTVFHRITGTTPRAYRTGQIAADPDRGEGSVR